ncbi:MAG: hypothetical protein AAF316_03605 [Cyanobacteria bacterium P01_A01_bin.80]
MSGLSGLSGWNWNGDFKPQPNSNTVGCQESSAGEVQAQDFPGIQPLNEG